MARGDQIYVIRPFLKISGVYEHHGIDCGDGSVIHYRKKIEVIERTPMITFTQGNQVFVKTYKTCFIPEVVIRRAESRLGEAKYNLLFNNCEHFANWCKTGMSYSGQIQDFIPILNRMQVDSLYEPIKQSLRDNNYTNQDKARLLLDEALAEIRVVWDDLQPSYKYAQKEMQAWEKVALQALNNNREDLARGAIRKKLDYQHQANALEKQLTKLAGMTETLIRNSQDWQNM